MGAVAGMLDYQLGPEIGEEFIPAGVVFGTIAWILLAVCVMIIELAASKEEITFLHAMVRFGWYSLIPFYAWAFLTI